MLEGNSGFWNRMLSNTDTGHRPAVNTATKPRHSKPKAKNRRRGARESRRRNRAA